MVNFPLVSETNRLESDAVNVWPLCMRNSTIFSYHTLGACFSPFIAFLSLHTYFGEPYSQILVFHGLLVFDDLGLVASSFVGASAFEIF